MTKLVVPRFATEREEAQWWDAHADVVGKNLIEAIKNGSAQQGTPQRLMREARESKNITIRMPLSDLDRARKLAQKKGIGYQTYMKMLLHEALEREESASKKSGRRKTA